MFLGGLPRRPDKATAHQQLRQHLAVVGVWLLAIRATPYVMHFLYRQPEELKLEL